MAKLSANGHELVRIQRELPIKDEDAHRILENRVERSFRSNGWILEKHSIKFAAHFEGGKPNLHSYGWKRRARMKPDVTVDKIKTWADRNGWEVVS